MIRFPALLGALLFSTTALADGVSGLALYGAPKYSADATHLDYADPAAPKGGDLRLAEVGSFDNLNPFILRGVAAAGAGMIFDTLTEGTADEPLSEYGRLAETIEVAPDRSWVAYTLRPEAHFNDGTPVTVEDVIWSFETLRDQGHPQYRLYYANVAKAEQTGPRTVRFTFTSTTNRELPLIMGELPVLPKHFFTKDRPFNATTLSPLVGSGPYEVAEVDAGRTISYRRVKDWWGKDLPFSHGRYNFDIIRYDYYRDADVAFQALKAGAVDFRLENSSKNWATGYDTPAVADGRLVREEIKTQDPQGMQGFVFNTRRPVFQDRQVREALAWLFDFEWTRTNLMYGQYQRSTSFFSNSDLAAEGPPTAAELAILEPYRGREPEPVFTQAFVPPPTDGSGNIRQNLRTALELLAKAGWAPKDGKLINLASGELLTFEILLDQPIFDRIVQPYLRNLSRAGISATVRMVDSAQYQNRLRSFDFDIVIDTIPESLSPGNEQREYWTSASAGQDGSRNLAGVRDPVVDALVDKLIAAPDRDTLVATTRALDRVLLWNWYVIPQWHNDRHRIAYWNRFSHPATPAKYGLPFESTWWVDSAKDAVLHR